MNRVLDMLTLVYPSGTLVSAAPSRPSALPEPQVESPPARGGAAAASPRAEPHVRRRRRARARVRRA